MQELQVFEYDMQPVRTVVIDGNAWFVARDVCAALELGDVSKAVARLDEDEKGTSSIRTPGGIQDVLVVNEPGLYSLVLGSRKPEARTFKRWITHEVIPSIRKTGKYDTQENVVPLSKEQALVTVLRTTADLVEGQEQIREMMAVQAQEIKTLAVKVEEQITLDSGEQRRLQKAVSKRVYELEHEPLKRPQLYSQLYREIKDRWAVPSYKDVRRTELQQVLRYIEAWRPRVA
ncbi:BRO family protein [Alicyclobacillus fastidiosus]|uniref:BRO family protein n=1 Tax=Alicyclobacillus fastidiosus TaxID=392011 RepID=A0ABY6ZIX9_9BACL|nr:BRO family protein [Alicyclobacillus fastidiosus]WAH42807.1 BRO family protein [Alicyclobacillus fastidiosus]GMA64730.1 antirepressor [Alicyclobacillus fastidiosus]